MNTTNRIKLEAEISATSKGLVDALNQASSAVNSTSESWKSRFDKLKDSTSTISQGVKNLSDLMKNIGDIDPSNVGKFNEALGEVSSKFQTVKGEVDAFVQSLAQMKIEASNLNMPIEEYQAFADAVKASGVGMEEAQGMVLAMQQNIQNLANGVPEAQSLFDRLGVTLEQISSNTVGANFQLLVNALNDTIPASERATQNMQLFKSSIDSTLQVAQQYQKTVSEQTNAYATDKEVQNAISLSSAIEKLGKQLGDYVNGANGATNANNGLTGSMGNLSIMTIELSKALESLKTAYDGYINSLDKMNVGAGDVFNVAKGKFDEVQEHLEFVKQQINREGFTYEWTDGLHDYEINMEKFVGFLSDMGKRIKTETDKINDLMNVRMEGKLPIDTKELQTTLSNLEEYLDLVNKVGKALKSYQGEFGISEEFDITPMTEQFDVLKERIEGTLIGAKSKMEEISAMSGVINGAFDFSDATESFNAFEKQVADAFIQMKQGEKVRIDTKQIDEAIEKIQRLQDKMQMNEAEKSILNPRVQESLAFLDDTRARLEEIRSRMVAVNTESEKQPSIISRAWRSFKNGVNYLTHFRSGVKGANGDAKELTSTFAKGIGQMMGMGSAVAVITTAFRNLNKLAKEYVKSLMEADRLLRYGNFGQNADSMTGAREKNDRRNEELINKLKEYSDLVREERSNPSNEARAKRKNLEDELNKQYGMTLNASNRGDVDTEIGRQLDTLTQKRLDAIDAQIKANQRVSDGVDEFINSFEGVGGYFKKLGYTFGEGDVNGSRAIEQAQERSNKAKEQTGTLMEQRRKLEREDLRGQFERMNDAKATDEAEKKRRDASEKATKALEEADKKLEEWKNSLTDNDRQKNLREIMDKYNSLVEEGVPLEEARNVAILAINKMLVKEHEDETKKNKELLKAMEERIDAYRKAYKDYVDAERDVRDAKRQYAKTQRELADEGRKDAMARKRERLQRQMGRFGFKPYEGFDLGEKPSERRERRRNAQLDASIAEKMAKSQGGDRVHFTRAEKERIAEFQKLQKQDKRLEASQKAMEASKKQEDAAEKLKEAAKAIREAIYGRKEARDELTKAGRELREANGKRRRRSQNDSPSLIFDNARKSMTARGVAGANATKQLDYSRQLGQLHTDLTNLNKRFFVVR